MSNAPRDWGAMAVLTFREQPREPKEALKKFVRSFRTMFGPDWQWAWVMEWQLRGVVHFHLFFERDLIERYGYSVEELTRHGHLVKVIRGFLDDWIVRKWIACVGDDHEDFQKFQRGGILEMLRTPDAAARYVAKEAGKRAQKQLPDGVNAAGRWWWISPAGKPRPTGVLTLKTWPMDKCYKLVFDTTTLTRKRPRDGAKLTGSLVRVRKLSGAMPRGLETY